MGYLVVQPWSSRLSHQAFGWLNSRTPKRLTLTLGLLVACSGNAHSAAAAPGFYEGKLSGELQGWTFWLATTSKEALGVAFSTGAPTSAENLVTVRGEGTIRKRGRGNAIDLKLYAVSPQTKSVRIGRIHGLSRTATGGYSGKFTLGGRSGTFSAAPVAAIPATSTGLTGTFISRRGSTDAAMKFTADGTFLLEGRVADRTVGRAQGNWQLDPDGYLWLLPTSVAESNDYFDMTMKLRVPLKLRAIRSGNQLELFEPLRNSHFASFTRQ